MQVHIKLHNVAARVFGDGTMDESGGPKDGNQGAAAWVNWRVAVSGNPEPDSDWKLVKAGLKPSIPAWTDMRVVLDLG